MAKLLGHSSLKECNTVTAKSLTLAAGEFAFNSGVSGLTITADKAGFAPLGVTAEAIAVAETVTVTTEGAGIPMLNVDSATGQLFVLDGKAVESATVGAVEVSGWYVIGHESVVDFDGNSVSAALVSKR